MKSESISSFSTPVLATIPFTERRTPVYNSSMAGSSIALGVSSSVINSSLEEKLRAQGVDPFEILAKLALNGDEETTRLQAAKELAKYLRPQLKAIDLKHSGQIQKTFAVLKFSDIDPAKAAELAKGITPERLLKMVAPNAAVLDHTRAELEREAVDGVVTSAAVEAATEDEEDEDAA